DDNDDDEENRLSPYETTPVDLLALDDHATPIFTRAVLKEIAAHKAKLIAHYAQRPEARTLQTLTRKDRHGNDWTIWTASQRDGDHKDKDSANAPNRDPNSVGIDYRCRVHLHPSKILGADHYNGALLHSEGPKSPPPFSFSNYYCPRDMQHLNPERMAVWRRRLVATKHLWKASQCRVEIGTMFRDAVPWVAPIRKIVCIGLGSLGSGSDDWYACVMQYMAAFTIKTTLDAAYAKTNPGCEPIRIIAQDPNYMGKDRVLLNGLFDPSGREKIDFVNDPHGLLAIDEQTLVMTAFLPHGVPLMQIVADMFPPGGGPAGFICDRMDLNVQQRMYSLRDRSSPGVARMLLQGRQYRNLTAAFDWHVPEPKLLEDVYGARDRGRWYWLRDMSLWLK
ncbi:hypothetical protein BDV95DRAFT_467935, partial [Massariosphaeria phaeospora]